MPLADAAVCRSESDWLVGINGTRAMTAFNSKDGGFHKTTVGRVQTPTLAILVEREERIKNFVTRDYWEVHGTFAGKGGEYPGPLVRRALSKRKEDDADARAERIWDQARAEAIRAKCCGKPGVVTEETKPTTQALAAALRPHQPAAGGERTVRLLGAHDALARAGALREAQGADLSANRLARPAGGLPRHGEEDARRAARERRDDARLCALRRPQILDEGWVRPNKRMFNNAKISDHFAIIPTAPAPKHLPRPSRSSSTW